MSRLVFKFVRTFGFSIVFMSVHKNCLQTIIHKTYISDFSKRDFQFHNINVSVALRIVGMLLVNSLHTIYGLKNVWGKLEISKTK